MALHHGGKTLEISFQSTSMEETTNRRKPAKFQAYAAAKTADVAMAMHPRSTKLATTIGKRAFGERDDEFSGLINR